MAAPSLRLSVAESLRLQGAADLDDPCFRVVHDVPDVQLQRERERKHPLRRPVRYLLNPDDAIVDFIGDVADLAQEAQEVIDPLGCRRNFQWPQSGPGNASRTPPTKYPGWERE